MNIFVNATAARTSGAYTILRQFLDALPRYGQEHRYFVFRDHATELPLIDNVEYIPIDTRKKSHRIRWDFSGMKRWAENRGITPDLIISFQNTGVRFPGVKQLIYYHQILPLNDHRWNPLKKEERKLFLYKRFYPYFVKKFITENTILVIQLEAFRKKLIERFAVNPENVFVIRPDLPQIDFGKIQVRNWDDGCRHFFYPATAEPYKNHRLLMEAVALLKKENRAEGIRIHLTLPGAGNTVAHEIKQRGLGSYFYFEGTLEREEVFSFYRSVDAVLFPSFIESFGLPLIEAAASGVPVICSDLPYSREVVGDYRGIVFAGKDDVRKWADFLTKDYPRTDGYTVANDSRWNEFFDLINRLN